MRKREQIKLVDALNKAVLDYSKCYKTEKERIAFIEGFFDSFIWTYNHLYKLGKLAK